MRGRELRGSRLCTGLLLLVITRNCAEGVHRVATNEFKDHEITRPKVYSGEHWIRDTLTQRGEHHNFITITFKAFKQNFHLDLKLNRDLLPSSYVERHFDSKGRIIVTKPHITKQRRTHCFYHGSLKFIPESVVAVSTCLGVSGFIYDAKETYHIEALGQNITGRHVIYRESDRRPRNFTCGHDNKKEENATSLRDAEDVANVHHRSKRSVHGPYDRTSKTRVVEIFVSNDHKQYLKYERDREKVIHRTKSIVNIVNSLYLSLDIRIALVGVEVWTEADQAKIMDDADDTMNNYLEYRKKSINPHIWNDNAQLITGHAFTDGVVGKAVKGVMCTYLYSGGVSMDHTDEVGPVATTMAHEIGHNFGMEHDSGACHCEDPRCIMAATSGGPNPTRWSSCSVQYLRDAFDQGLDYCLLNWPLQTYQGGVCGNGFVEDGEECDCGLPEDCTSRCCDAVTCKLFANATCATGQCCQQDICQLKAAGSMCRPVSDDQCDLPEYCNGHSEWCPDDVYMQNGHECLAAQMQAYCYHGKCQSHSSQCKLLWGNTGQNANWECYKYFNRMGIAAGNCEYNWVTNIYKKCDHEDVLCGLLHCDHANEKLMFWKEALSLTIPENWVMVNATRYECKGAILDVGLNSRDPGMVPDGAKCGDNKMCVHHQCRPLHLLGFNMCPNGCNNFGVCNSNGNCHCDVGFGPPYCDSPGNGGSIDSGPIKVLDANVALIIGICLFFLVIAPLLATAAYLMYKNREKLKMYVSVPTQPKPPPPPPPKPRPVCKAVPVRSTSNVSSGSISRPAKHVQRMSSFRDMEISTPVFQSSTNKTHVTRLSNVNSGDPLVRPASVVVPTSPREPLADRPNSVIVQGVCDQNQANVVSLASLSEEGNIPSRNKNPARPPFPQVWTTTSMGRDDYISAPMPIQTRPLPALPNKEISLDNSNSPQHKKTDSVYYNEDSEDDLDKTVDSADVRVTFNKDPPNTRQPYVNMTPSRKAPTAPGSRSRNPTVPQQQAKTTSVQGNKNLGTNKKTGSTTANSKDSKAKTNAGQSSTKTATKNSINPTKTPSHVGYNPTSKFQKMPTTSDKKENNPIHNNQGATGGGSSAGVKKTVSTVNKNNNVPAVPPHKTKASKPSDSPIPNTTNSDEYINADSSATKPVGIVAAMKQKFATENKEQQPESSAVTRSKSSVTPEGRPTRPVTRTQTSAAEIRTNRATKPSALESQTVEKNKPPPLPSKPPLLSRSVSTASDTNSKTDSDMNRKRAVVRTKSSAGDRPKLPVPPKPPATKRNSSVC